MAGVGIRGMSSPIVDDEGCDFLCRWKQTLAELIEIDGASIGDTMDAVRALGVSCLPSMLAD
jgi:hypothetical protein